jgi:hypothetical protein
MKNFLQRSAERYPEWQKLNLSVALIWLVGKGIEKATGSEPTICVSFFLIAGFISWSLQMIWTMRDARNGLLSIGIIATISLSSCDTSAPTNPDLGDGYSVIVEARKDYVYVQIDSIISRPDLAFDAYGDPLQEGHWYILSTKAHSILPAEPPSAATRSIMQTTAWELPMWFTDSGILVKVALLGPSHTVTIKNKAVVRTY